MFTCLILNLFVVLFVFCVQRGVKSDVNAKRLLIAKCRRCAKERIKEKNSKVCSNWNSIELWNSQIITATPQQPQTAPLVFTVAEQLQQLQGQFVPVEAQATKLHSHNNSSSPRSLNSGARGPAAAAKCSSALCACSSSSSAAAAAAAASCALGHAFSRRDSGARASLPSAATAQQSSAPQSDQTGA